VACAGIESECCSLSTEVKKREYMCVCVCICELMYCRDRIINYGKQEGNLEIRKLLMPTALRTFPFEH